jgi:hypothetical protein
MNGMKKLKKLTLTNARGIARSLRSETGKHNKIENEILSIRTL